MEDKSSVLEVTFKAALLASWTRLELACEACGVAVRFDLQRFRDRTKHRVVSEFVTRARCRFCGGQPATAFLVRKALRADPLKELTFHVEEWSEDGQTLQGLLSACHSATVGRATFEVTAKERPRQVITLRKGTWLIATTLPDPQPDNVSPIGDRRTPRMAGEPNRQVPAIRRQG